jgi:hypothetical protein
MTRAELQRRLATAFRGEHSAIIAEASQLLGSLAAVYSLLDHDRSKEVR